MRPARFVAAACVIAAALSLPAVPAVAVPRLDAHFGDGGIARVPFKFRGFREFFGALRPVRQADGKLLVAAQAFGDRNAEEFVLARFDPAGALDTSFGRRGRVRIDFRWQFQPRTVLAQRDGRIVLVGTVGGSAYFASQPSQLGIVRLLPDGSRDISFGTNGVVVWNPPWRAADEWMDVFPDLALPQPDGRLLVAAHVDERTLRVYPEASWRRVVLVRFQQDGSVDQSFGQAGLAELDWDDGYFRGWARLADGRLASVVSRNEGTGQPTLESTAWWLHSFAVDGSSAAALRSTGSGRLGLDVLDELVDLLPTRDGGLLMIGYGPATAVRRILPDGSLDPAFGRECGGTPPADGDVLVTATKLRIHARPRRFDTFVSALDATGCTRAAPLQLRGLLAGPRLLQRGRGAFLGASYDGGLALVKIRR